METKAVSKQLDSREANGINAHEDTSQIQLDLETDVHVRAVDRRAPPEREPTVRNLGQTVPLSVGQLFVSHGLLETGGLLPEETYHHIRLKQCS